MNKDIKKLVESIKRLSTGDLKILLKKLNEDTENNPTIQKIIYNFIKDKYNLEHIEDAYAKYWNGKFYNNDTVIYVDNKKLHLSSDVIKQIKELPLIDKKKENVKSWRDVYSRLCSVRQELYTNMREIIPTNKYDINAYQLQEEILMLVEVLAQSKDENDIDGKRLCRGIAKRIMKEYPK